MAAPNPERRAKLAKLREQMANDPVLQDQAERAKAIVLGDPPEAEPDADVTPEQLIDPSPSPKENTPKMTPRPNIPARGGVGGRGGSGGGSGFKVNRGRKSALPMPEGEGFSIFNFARGGSVSYGKDYRKK